MMSRATLRGTFLIFGLVALAAFTLPMVAQEQASQKGKKSADHGKAQMAMNCPMMAALKGIELHSDNPALLLARADELELTEEQQRQLHQLVETNRRQAQELLNEQQREQLQDAPEGPLTPMQIAMMRMKGKAAGQTAQEGQMCPMCMKMMQQKHHENGAQQEKHHSKKRQSTQE